MADIQIAPGTVSVAENVDGRELRVWEFTSAQWAGIMKCWEEHGYAYAQPLTSIELKMIIDPEKYKELADLDYDEYEAIVHPEFADDDRPEYD